ncbi:MAG: ABC transporter permease [Acidobacteriota bacterium]|nr:ABC transporter permease [Acidobacteriota bacterium]
MRLRSLLARPGFALAAVGMLALGIGITTAMFTIVDALLLRPVPFHAPQELAFVYMGNENGGRTTVAPAVLRAWRDSPAFAGAEGANADTAVVETGGTVATRGSARVTTGLFGLLGNVRPIRGRLFEPSDGRAGSDDRVMLSEDLWRSLYGADPGIINQRVTIDNESLLVVGVLPSDFRFPNSETVIWRPIDYDAPPAGREADRPTAYVRFAPALPRDEAIRLATAAAHDADATTAKLVPRVSPMAGLRLDDYSRRAVPLLAGAVALVFLVLCANVCSLLLSRLTDAGREFSIRAALGASRATLIRHALVESAVLGTSGAIVGAGIAWAAVALARTYLPESFVLQTLNPLDLDRRALLAASVAGISATLASGLIPAWIGTRVDSGDSLRGVGRSGTDSRASRGITRALLVSEIALACTLLTAATLLVRSFANLSGVERGVDSSRVVTATMTLPPSAFPETASRAAIAASLDQRMRDLPGVRQVAWSFGLPPSGGGFATREWLADQGGSPGVTMTVNTYNVTADFFPIYGIPIIMGRGFQPSDQANQVIAGERFARALWGAGNPVGRTFTYARNVNSPTAPPPTVYEVIGVAREQTLPTLEARLDRPEFYLPFGNIGGYAMMSIGCDLSCPDSAVVRQRLSTSHPAIRVNDVRTLDSAFAEHLTRPRAAAVLAFAFAAIAVIAAAGGLFSVLSYAVGRRRREFGIRAAIGASPRQLGQVVLREGLLITFAGISIGGIGSVALGRALSSLQYGMAATDPVSLALVVTILVLTAVAAGWRPARQAIRTDPVVLVREE